MEHDDVQMTDLTDVVGLSYFQGLLDSLLEQIFRDFDESFNGRSDTALLRTVCKNFRRIIDTSIPFFCLYRTLTDAINQHNQIQFSSPWLTKHQWNIHSVLFNTKPLLRNFTEQHDLPDDPKDEPLLALEILLSTIRAEEYVKYNYPALSPYIEVIFMPFAEVYGSMFSWSCFTFTIPNKAKQFGGKKILFEYREYSVYIHVEDERLADYLGLPGLDVEIRPSNLNEFDYLPQYAFRTQVENIIGNLLDDDLRQEFTRNESQYDGAVRAEKKSVCKDRSTKLLKYSPKLLISALPTLPRSLYLLVTDHHGNFWNNLYSCQDLADRFRITAIHKPAILKLVSDKYKNSEVGELVEIMCRTVEYVSEDKIYFYTPKAEKIVLFNIRTGSKTYYYRYDELTRITSQEITDQIDEDIAVLRVQKELNFPRLLTPELFTYILKDFSDKSFKNQSVDLPQPPPLREGAQKMLKTSFPYADPSAQIKLATVYTEEHLMDNTSSNNTNSNTNQKTQLIYSSCRTSPSIISDKDHYSLLQILQVNNGEKTEFYFHLRIGHLLVLRPNTEHFVHTIKISIEEAKALFDYWLRYFTRKGLYNAEPNTFKTVLHAERLPHYPELVRKGEFDPDLAPELLQVFPSVTAYLIQAEVTERQNGVHEAIKVIDEAFEYGTKFRASKSVQLWNKKIELFIKVKEPIKAFECYIMSCHHVQPRKFPEKLYVQMMRQLERDTVYEMQMSPDHLILHHIFKTALITTPTNRDAIQLLGPLVQSAKTNHKGNHPDIFPIKEIFDVLSNDVRIEFLPSDHEERKLVLTSALFGNSKLKPTDEIAVWKVHSKFLTDASENNSSSMMTDAFGFQQKEWFWTTLRQPLWLPIILTKGQIPKSNYELLLERDLPASTLSLFCEMNRIQNASSSKIIRASISSGDILPVKYIVLTNSEKRDEANADVIVRFLNLLDSRSNQINGQFVAACCNYFEEYVATSPFLAKKRPE